MTYDELERIKTKIYPNTISGKNENVVYTINVQRGPSAAGTGMQERLGHLPYRQIKIKGN